MLRKNGFSLIELAVVLFLTGLLVSTVMPGFLRTLQIEAAKKTAVEMTRFSEAVRSYRQGEFAWPPDLQSLRDRGYIYADWTGNNAFGNPYLLVPGGASMAVRTKVPLEMAGLVARAAPMSSVLGEEVTVDVMAEGAAVSAVPVGSIIPWPAAVIPEGWLVCAGQEVARADYAVLFTLIGTTYGSGDGTLTFQLPDLRGRVPAGLDNMGGSAANVISLPGAAIIGGRFGEEKHILNLTEIPAHKHNLSDYTFSENMGWGGSAQGNAESQDYDNIPTAPYFHATENAGGNLAHNNLQPSLALFWIIKVK